MRVAAIYAPQKSSTKGVAPLPRREGDEERDRGLKGEGESN